MDNKRRILTVINLFLFISTLIVTILGILHGAGEGQLGENMRGAGWLKAFTNLSNMLMGFCALVFLVTAKNGKNPKWAVRLYFAGVCAVGLTFVVVIFFLAPMFAITGKGFFTMYSGSLLFFHFLNPILAVIAMMFLIKKPVLGTKEKLLGLIPTVLYSFLYAYKVVISKEWDDFYNFTLGGKMWMVPVAMLVLYSVTYAIGSLMASVHNRTVES